nr:hypothetical protein [Candidatus Dormibacteraeota bacterium]
MGRPLLPFLAALCLLACTYSGPPSPAVSPSPPLASPTTSPPIATRPPTNLVLADADVGLAHSSGRDDITLAQAASEQQNQPLALTWYRTWGWVAESTRSWSDGSRRLDESLVLLTRTEGAILAFQGWTGELTQHAACPVGLGLDECAEGSGSLVARVGRYVFRLVGAGVVLENLAAVQA